MTCQELNGPPLSPARQKAYLARLELTPPAAADLAALTRLQSAHMTHIPFDNLQVLSRKPLSLNREDLYEKLIVQRRGGLCAELNGLYNWLLESLGFAVTSYNSRIIASTLPLQPQTHRLLGVTFGEETYLTDVGWSMEHHRIPLKLEEGLVQEDSQCAYRLTRRGALGWILAQKRPGLPWREILSFNPYPQIDLDYVTPAFYSCYSDNSRVNKSTRVSRFTETALYAIRDGQFLRERRGVEEVLETALTPARERLLLEEVFQFPPEELAERYEEEAEKDT